MILSKTLSVLKPDKSDVPYLGVAHMKNKLTRVKQGKKTLLKLGTETTRKTSNKPSELTTRV